MTVLYIIIIMIGIRSHSLLFGRRGSWGSTVWSCEHQSYCHVPIIQTVKLCAVKPIHHLSWSYLRSAAVRPEATIPLLISLLSGVLRLFAAFAQRLFSQPDSWAAGIWNRGDMTKSINSPACLSHIQVNTAKENIHKQFLMVFLSILVQYQTL